MVLFLMWTFLFWPAFAATEYLVRQLLGVPFLLDAKGDFVFILLILWIVGILATFLLYRRTLGIVDEDDEDDEVELVKGEPKPNTLIIVEKPNSKLVKEIGAVYLEHEARFDLLPKIGARIVLNPDDGEPNIIGTVIEMGEVARSSADEMPYRIWVELDRVEDYVGLDRSLEWNEGEGDKRRSTHSSLRPAAA